MGLSQRQQIKIHSTEHMGLFQSDCGMEGITRNRTSKTAEEFKLFTLTELKHWPISKDKHNVLTISSQYPEL